MNILYHYWAVFLSSSLIVQIQTLGMIITLMCSIVGLCITPFIWNFVVIPNIEKRAGKKIEFPWYNDIFLFSGFYSKQGICLPIVVKYIAYKITKDPYRIKKHGDLRTINYDVSKATIFELFMAFFTLGLTLLFLIGFGLGVGLTFFMAR